MNPERLDLNALAESGDSELDARDGVQEVTWSMILKYALDELPPPSAEAFADWLNREWYGFNEGGDLTNGEVLSGALRQWRGE